VLEGVREMTKKDVGMLSRVLIIMSLFSILMSAVGYLGRDVWLASTQWLLVAAVLGTYSIYAKLES
jgi:hypothetical protein